MSKLREAQVWYEELQRLASVIGVSVADRDAWLEDWEEGLTPKESLEAEYPEECKALSE